MKETPSFFQSIHQALVVYVFLLGVLTTSFAVAVVNLIYNGDGLWIAVINGSIWCILMLLSVSCYRTVESQVAGENPALKQLLHK